MKTVEVVCAVIINDKKEFFMCKRGPGRALEGFFEFPGGKVEKSETNEDAIIREIKEELNTEIKPISFLITSDYTYNDLGEYQPFRIIMHAYLCELIKGELTLMEHTESLWTNKNNIDLISVAPADIVIVDKVKEILGY